MSWGKIVQSVDTEVCAFCFQRPTMIGTSVCLLYEGVQHMPSRRLHGRVSVMLSFADCDAVVAVVLVCIFVNFFVGVSYCCAVLVYYYSNHDNWDIACISVIIAE